MSRNRPPRALVERIAREEAIAARVRFSDILTGRDRRSVRARRAALRRIKRETDCSTFGLAAVFGCDHGAVLDAMAMEPAAPPPTLYDALTVERLRWAHGEARASQIIAGADPRTNADLQAWRRIIVHGEQP
jgi:hypothetical protein